MRRWLLLGSLVLLFTALPLVLISRSHAGVSLPADLPYSNHPNRTFSAGVLQAQTALAQRGYAVGTLDGLYGSKTEAAVKAYQRAVKLPETGILGPATWRSLMAPTAPKVPGKIVGKPRQPAIPTGSYSIDTKLTTVPGVTGDQLDAYLRRMRPGSPLIGLGSTWVDVGQRYGINPIYLMAHAIHESAWGTSYLARTKNNIYGWRAFDQCPNSCGARFKTKAASVEFVAAALSRLYLTPGGQFMTSHGPTLRGVNTHYATDRNWKNAIARLMNSFNRTVRD